MTQSRETCEVLGNLNFRCTETNEARDIHSSYDENQKLQSTSSTNRMTSKRKNITREETQKARDHILIKEAGTTENVNARLTERKE